MKLQFLFLYSLLSLNISFSQDLNEYQSIENLKSDDLKMYNLLVESINNITGDTVNTHIFPIYKKSETNNYLLISTIAYLKSRHNSKKIYELESQTYSYSLKFRKKRRKKEVPKNEDNYEITDPTPSESGYLKGSYFIMVINDTYSKNERNHVVFRVAERKPFYWNSFDQVKFSSNKIRENLIDKSLYKNVAYDNVQFANKDIAILKDRDKVGVINSLNDTLVHFKYKKITLYNICLIAEKENSRKTLYDKDFNLVGEFDWINLLSPSDYIRRFVDGFLTTNNSLRSYYSYTAFEKVTGDYTAIIGANRSFSIGINDNKSTLINFGTWKETTYDSIKIPKSQTFENDRLIVHNKVDKKWGVLRLTDKIETILEPKYESISQNVVLDVDTNYSKVRYIVNKMNKYALYDSKLGWLTEFEFNDISFLNNHYLMRKGKKILLFDANGNLKSKTKYDKIELNDDKQFIGYKKSKYEIIETN